jgi:hypothetical protein
MVRKTLNSREIPHLFISSRRIQDPPAEFLDRFWPTWKMTELGAKPNLHSFFHTTLLRASLFGVR